MIAEGSMPAEPVQLKHSWPLFELGTRFAQGLAFDPGPAATVGRPLPRTIGHWSCNLADNELTWSAAVHALFGLPGSARPSRAETVALYAEPSRAVMERLRAHAIHHRRGFTLDAEIIPVTGPRRWMRLIAAPVIEADRVVRLWGLKSDVTPLYRR